MPFGNIDQVVVQRSRQFLRSQTAILLFSLAVTVFARASGLLDQPVSRRNLAAGAVLIAATAVGWAVHFSRRYHLNVVAALLMVDAAVGYPLTYLSGSIDKPAVAGLLLCILMTPLFSGRGHVVRATVAHWSLFTGILWLDTSGHLGPWLQSFGFAPPPSTDAPVETWMAFTVACFGTAFLAGQASVDILESQAQLQDEVRRNHAALATATSDLERNNEELGQLNIQLETANEDLTLLNRELETTIRELAVVNEQLGQSNNQLGIANEELAETNRALQRSNERLDQFNVAVSHDLRAPLQAMMARAEMAALAAHTDPTRVARMADQICESAARMARQLDEMHRLSRLEERLDRMEPVHIGPLLGEIAHELDPKIREKRLHLEVIHPLPHVMGSRPLLAELFQNLLDNAIKYGNAEQPRVRVAAEPAPDGQVAVSIEDNGQGIPEDQRAKVFQLFRRLPRDQDQDGVGAGLAIVQRIASVHGGSVWIEDGTRLSGARIVVRLPGEPSATPPRARTTPAVPLDA